MVSCPSWVGAPLMMCWHSQLSAVKYGLIKYCGEGHSKVVTMTGISLRRKSESGLLALGLGGLLRQAIPFKYLELLFASDSKMEQKMDGKFGAASVEMQAL